MSPMERAAAWFDQPMPSGCWLVFPAGKEPAEWRTWDLYGLDDYDYVGAVPPGMWQPNWMQEGSFGCCQVASVDLPNGWTLVVGYHS